MADKKVVIIYGVKNIINKLFIFDNPFLMHNIYIISTIDKEIIFTIL